MAQKTNDKSNLVFDFWKDNKVENHFTLTIGDITVKWYLWLDYQINENKDRGDSWYDHYYGSQAVRCFIADKEEIFGLQSVLDNDQFDTLYELIRKHFK